QRCALQLARKHSAPIYTNRIPEFQRSGSYSSLAYSLTSKLAFVAVKTGNLHCITGCVGACGLPGRDTHSNVPCAAPPSRAPSSQTAASRSGPPGTAG
ncbi:hypothetical protein ANANG_G00219780, partial [Anguilla anguilla]